MGFYSKIIEASIMKLIDLHADTITALYYNPEHYAPEQEFILDNPVEALAKNQLYIDLDKLRLADSLAQFFVLWLNLKACDKYRVKPWDHFVKLYNLAQQQFSKNSADIVVITNLSELNLASQTNKLAAILCVEEGGFISNLEELELSHQMGIRYITLVWNYDTHIGVPSKIDQTRGLKPFGFEMVKRMQELGMLVDVSHLSDRGVADVLSIAAKPIIASHSNARTLCDHARNLPDELIKGIANNGGVIGINCVPNFLSSSETVIKIDTMIGHIKHVYNLAGEDSLAIGNDFDGFESKTPDLDEIQSIADLPKLASRLSLAGFSERQIEKIFAKNVLRVLTF